jgi:hypothetical protein
LSSYTQTSCLPALASQLAILPRRKPRRQSHSLSLSPCPLATTIGATSRHRPRRELTRIPSIRRAATAPHLDLLVAHAGDGGGRYGNVVHVMSRTRSVTRGCTTAAAAALVAPTGAADQSTAMRAARTTTAAAGTADPCMATRHARTTGAGAPAPRSAGEAADVQDLLQGRGQPVQPALTVTTTCR